MPSSVVRIELERSVREKLEREDPLLTRACASVTCIRGPAEAGPFATEEQLDQVVNQALAFHKDVLLVYDLGDGLLPIAVAKGRTRTFIAGESRYHEDDDSIHYTLDHNGFDTLGAALVYALALRDRGNPNDARPTAACIGRLLTAAD